MELKELASQLRRHDWTACMSDDNRVWSRARQHMATLSAAASESKNHARLVELACVHHGSFTWRALEGEAPQGTKSREEVYEAAWRWVGAYLWAHGVKVSEAEARSYVGAVDGHREWYGKMVSTAKTVDWKKVDAAAKLAA